MTPLKLRGYTVERLLGSGGSGEVWQARIGTTGSRVALKRVPISDAEQLRRAQAEAALLAALEHPNLVRLHSLITLDDAAVLVLDLADGGSLAQLLAARGRLAVGEVITLVASIGAALAYLHEHAVVHGDVAAANILFTASGVPLLADVGVARLTGDDADAEATPAYVDPAVAGGCVPGPPSDVFMLGAVALHALTGAPPWPDLDAEAALERAARGVLDDASDRLAAAGIGSATAAVVCRALSVDPQRRGTAGEFALDLRHSGEPIAIELGAGTARVEPRLVTPGPRHAARPAVSRSVADVASAELPPTRMVAPRPRPLIPRPARRRLRPRLVAAAGAVAIAGMLAFVATAFARGGHGAASASARPSAVDWAAVLADLDGLRAHAFATRNPRLLEQLYGSTALLVADTRLLESIVAPGCRLVGVRTRYAEVRAASHGPRRATVVALATLEPSRLRCPGHADRIAPGAGPTRLRLELRGSAGGIRIVAQRSVSG